jgi:hypothetical protein
VLIDDAPGRLPFARGASSPNLMPRWLRLFYEQCSSGSGLADSVTRLSRLATQSTRRGVFAERTPGPLMFQNNPLRLFARNTREPDSILEK